MNLPRLCFKLKIQTNKLLSYTKPIFNFFELEKNVMKMNKCQTHCLYQSRDSVEFQIAASCNQDKNNLAAVEVLINKQIQCIPTQ